VDLFIISVSGRQGYAFVALEAHFRENGVDKANKRGREVVNLQVLSRYGSAGIPVSNNFLNNCGMGRAWM
jgi:hypothetical protein